MVGCLNVQHCGNVYYTTVCDNLGLTCNYYHEFIVAFVKILPLFGCTALGLGVVPLDGVSQNNLLVYHKITQGFLGNRGGTCSRMHFTTALVRIIMYPGLIHSNVRVGGLIISPDQ